MNISDTELLRRYTRDHSEPAFEELVRRHVDLVYSAALRQVNGDPTLAEEITQSVFIDLARKAAQLTKHTALTGWLYTSTRFIAANLRRTEQRRAAREQEAYAMNALSHSVSQEPDWAQIRPVLDDAMHRLDEQDRNAVLLRHFEHRSFSEIGQQLGLTENTARMRVTRALEKLQETLRKRGVTSSALALAALLDAKGVGAAPAHLAARIARAVLTGLSAGGLSALLAYLFANTWVKLIAGACVLAAVIALIAIANHRRYDAPPAAQNPALAASANAPPLADAPTSNSPAVAEDTNGLVLHLKIVTADSGKPIPHVPVEYRGGTGNNFRSKSLVSDRFGGLNVFYPTNIGELELTTREDDFADTKLLWRPANGDVIPANYLLKLERAVPIGGTVVDANNLPVAGAMVGWNHSDDPAGLKLPENHEFGWIEVATDKAGRWRINRIAADMISRIYGSARESNHVDSEFLYVTQEKNAEKELREETHVFRLGDAISIKGVVVDESGQGIPGAKVFAGYLSGSDRRESKSGKDGTFEIGGCAPGKRLVTADAKGYTVTTVEADIGTNSEPVRLVVHPGRILRLRVVNKSGQPIANADINYQPYDRHENDGKEHPAPPQVDYSPVTDKEGRVVWTNAPGVEMAFDVAAAGYFGAEDTMITPDGEEHTIVLAPALTVHGAVVDEATGQPIPHFRIALGWPEVDFQTGQYAPRWAPIGRFWFDFANGTYRQVLEEPPVSGKDDGGYYLKFMADGHETFVSRVIKPDEGDVRLDVSLKGAGETVVFVYTPDGKLAGNADVGLVSPGSQLALGQGGFSRGSASSARYLLKTGTDGSFKLPADKSVSRVIVASAGGYAEALPGVLATNPVMKMQLWGRLEATCTSGGKPEAGRQYSVRLGGSDEPMLSMDFEVGHITSDAAGRMSVAMLPPGWHYLARVRSIPLPGRAKGWMPGGVTRFQIRAGETTTLNLETNYVVTAHMQWPAGVARLPEIGASARLIPVSPETDAVADEQNNPPEYPLRMRPGDNLAGQDVPPGDYTLSVLFYSMPTNGVSRFVSPGAPGTKTVAAGTMKITVPADPPAGTFDAGTIQLQPAADGQQ